MDLHLYHQRFSDTRLLYGRGIRGRRNDLSTFFLVLCACNLSVAVIVAALERVFNPFWLVRVNRVLGVFLLLVAVRFVILGATKLGVFDEGLEETGLSTLSILLPFVC